MKSFKGSHTPLMNSALSTHLCLERNVGSFGAALTLTQLFGRNSLAATPSGDYRDKEGESKVKLSAPQTDLLCMLTRLYSAKASSDYILSKV